MAAKKIPLGELPPRVQAVIPSGMTELELLAGEEGNNALLSGSILARVGEDEAARAGCPELFVVSRGYPREDEEGFYYEDAVCVLMVDPV